MFETKSDIVPNNFDDDDDCPTTSCPNGLEHKTKDNNSMSSKNTISRQISSSYSFDSMLVFEFGSFGRAWRKFSARPLPICDRNPVQILIATRLTLDKTIVAELVTIFCRYERL